VSVRAAWLGILLLLAADAALAQFRPLRFDDEEPITTRLRRV